MCQSPCFTSVKLCTRGSSPIREVVLSFFHRLRLKEVNDCPKAMLVVTGEPVLGSSADSEAGALNHPASQPLLQCCFYYCGPEGIKFFVELN